MINRESFSDIRKRESVLRRLDRNCEITDAQVRQTKRKVMALDSCYEDELLKAENILTTYNTDLGRIEKSLADRVDDLVLFKVNLHKSSSHNKVPTP